MNGNLIAKNENEMRQIIKQINAFDVRISALGNLQNGQPYDQIQKESESRTIETRLMLLCNRLMRLVSKHTMLRTLEWSESFRQTAAVIGIDAKEYGGDLFVRSPYPPRRFHETFTGNRACLAVNIDAVTRKLRRYDEKILFIINAYEKSSAIQNAYVCDFDNYDYKNLIDETCRFYPNTDNPKTTTICYRSVFTNRLKPMTYLIVTGLTATADLSADTLIAYLERVWHT